MFFKCPYTRDSLGRATCCNVINIPVNGIEWNLCAAIDPLLGDLMISVEFVHRRSGWQFSCQKGEGEESSECRLFYLHLLE